LRSQDRETLSYSSPADTPMEDNMIRRSRKKGNGRSGPDSSSKAREEAMKRRLESISGYDFDKDEAKEVEERIRRMSYGHKVEK
jgi:hypothetical protein